MKNKGGMKNKDVNKFPEDEEGQRPDGAEVMQPESLKDIRIPPPFKMVRREQPCCKDFKQKVRDVLDLEVKCDNAMWLMGYNDAVKNIKRKLGLI